MALMMSERWDGPAGSNRRFVLHSIGVIGRTIGACAGAAYAFRQVDVELPWRLQVNLDIVVERLQSCGA